METTNKLCEICSKLTIKTPERHPLWTYFTHCSGVSFVDFELVNPSWVSCKEKKVNFSFHFASSEKMLYLIGEKKVGEKWLNFLQVTNFFPGEIFPRLSFSLPVFFPDFFTPHKEFIPIFFSIIIIIYLQNLLLPCFLWCTLLNVVEQSSFNKNFEMRVKAMNWKK